MGDQITERGAPKVVLEFQTPPFQERLANAEASVMKRGISTENPEQGTENSRGVETKKQPLEMMSFQSPPNRIQPGECPIMFVSGDRNPDGTMVEVAPVPLPTKQSGNFAVLHADHRGRVHQQLLPDLLPRHAVPDFRHLGSKFFESTEGYFFQSIRGDFVQMTDFRVKVLERQKVQAIDGTVTESILARLYDDRGWELEIEVPVAEWNDLFDTARKKAPERLVASDEVPRERFKTLTSHILKRSKPCIRCITTFWGWGERLEDGSRKFRHGGMLNCKSPKKLLPVITDAEYRRTILRKGFEVQSVGPIEFTAPVLAYCASSYLDALLIDAGRDLFLSFCLMEIGKSGFGKTSFTRTVSSVATPAKERIVTVRSTEAAMYVEQEKAFDDTFNIDDYNREGSPQEIQKKQKIIQAIVRSYSDRTPRKKWVGMTASKGSEIRGGCIITGETKMIGQISSAELRYVKIFLTQRLDGKILAEYQSQPEIMLHFFGEWIRYLEKNYTQITERIGWEIPMRRQEFSVLQEGRLVDACSYLTFTVELMAEWLVDTGALTKDEGESWKHQFKTVMTTILKKQLEEIRVEEPVVQYLSEVWNLIGTGKLLLAPNLDTYAKDLPRYGGYIEDGVYMLKKDETHVAVTTAFKARGDYFTSSIGDIAKALKKEGLTRYDADGCLKRASSKIKGRPRMLALIRSKCEKRLEDGRNGISND